MEEPVAAQIRRDQNHSPTSRNGPDHMQVPQVKHAGARVFSLLRKHALPCPCAEVNEAKKKQIR